MWPFYKPKTLEKPVDTLEISVSEYYLLQKWMAKHTSECLVVKKKGPGLTKLKFITQICSGIGKGTDVVCECGKKVDITDVSNW